VKSELLKTIRLSTEKQFTHKICNLIIEVGGIIYDESDSKLVWQEMLNLIFEFVNSNDANQVDAAL
jgi:hypothetical protein